MPDLPPIGSLWLHRESGERREVVDLCHWGDPPDINTDVDFNGPNGPRFSPLPKWLSWAAHADRIDKEEA